MNMPGTLTPFEIDSVFSHTEKKIKESPDSFYPYFKRHAARYRHGLELVDRHYNSGAVLDIGCFPPHFTILLNSLGYRATGIDINPDRSRLLNAQFDLSIIKWDIERATLPFPDGKFGFVIFNEVLEHLHKDPLFALSELTRILATGGHLLLTTPNIYAIQRLVRFLYGKSFNDSLFELGKLRSTGHMGHLREYAPDEIRRFMVMNNFRIVQKAYRHYHYPVSGKGMVARILFTVCPPFLRTYQIIVAKKMGPGPGLTPSQR